MILSDFTNPLLVLAAVLVAVMGVGRFARLVTFDDYPPTIAIRSLWNRITGGNGWAKLAYCQWCFTPWVMLACIGWFIWGTLGQVTWLMWAWWIFWGWLGLSYTASIIVRRDEPEE